jgi:hypothetical protein
MESFMTVCPAAYRFLYGLDVIRDDAGLADLPLAIPETVEDFFQSGNTLVSRRIFGSSVRDDKNCRPQCGTTLAHCCEKCFDGEMWGSSGAVMEGIIINARATDIDLLIQLVKRITC